MKWEPKKRKIPIWKAKKLIKNYIAGTPPEYLTRFAAAWEILKKFHISYNHYSDSEKKELYDTFRHSMSLKGVKHIRF